MTAHNHNAVIERAIVALERSIHVWPNGKTTGFTTNDDAESALDAARPVIEALTDALTDIVENIVNHSSGLSAAERQDFRSAIMSAIDETTYDARHCNDDVDPADTLADWQYDCRDQRDAE